MIIYMQVVMFLRGNVFVLVSSHPRNILTLVSRAVLMLFFYLDYFNSVGCRINHFNG